MEEEEDTQTDRGYSLRTFQRPTKLRMRLRRYERCAVFGFWFRWLPSVFVEPYCISQILSTGPLALTRALSELYIKRGRFLLFASCHTREKSEPVVRQGSFEGVTVTIGTHGNEETEQSL